MKRAMGYIPKDAEYYLAEIVLEIAVTGEAESLVHTNLVLVRADSPDEAYTKALELGHAGEYTEKNSDGTEVSVRFRGLRDLNVIHDKLGHGAELIYREDTFDEAAIARWVSPKEALGVFASPPPRS